MLSACILNAEHMGGTKAADEVMFKGGARVSLRALQLSATSLIAD